jgi:hypothetical protein
MLLRTKMRPHDVNMIRQVAMGSSSESAKALRDKMAREKAYKLLIERTKRMVEKPL